MSNVSHDKASTAGLFFWFLLLFGGGIAVALLRSDPNPWISVALVLAPPVLVFTIRRFPAAFLPPVIFAAKFKSKAAEGFDPSDPTFVCLALLLVVLCVHLFFFYVQARGATLRYLFAGQWKVIRWFLLLEFLLAFSYLHTISPEYGATLVWKMLTIDLFLFIVPLLLLRDERDFRQFTFVMIALAVPLSILRMFTTLTSSAGTTEDVTQIGAGHLIGMTILLMVNYQATEKKWLRSAIFLTFPLLTAGLIATDARGPAFACLGLLGISIFKGQGGRFFSGTLAKLGILAMVIAVVGFTAYKMTSTGNRRVSQKREEIMQMLSGEVPRGGVSSRLFGYAGAISGFVKKPILGWGAGGSRGYLANYHGPFGINGADVELKYPHNIVLQVAAEQGIFGLAALLAFLWGTYKTTRSISRATDGRLSCFLWVFLFDVFCMMVSGDLDNWRAVWLWSGMALATARMISAGIIPSQAAAVVAVPKQQPSRRIRFDRIPQSTLSR
ncbi:MAG: O-antigen ligase family protein [Bryobacteraceae bacterium]